MRRCRRKREDVMRILIAIPLLLALAACNVSKNGNAVTVQYDQNTAENTASAVGNTAQNIASDIGNDVQNTGEKIQNKVGNTDISVNVNKDVKTENKEEKKSK
jgi:predicted small secreted protein